MPPDTIKSRSHLIQSITLQSLLCTILFVTTTRAEPLLEVHRFANADALVKPDLQNLNAARIPILGLAANFVPQGLCDTPDKKHHILSGYLADTKQSLLLALDARTGKPIRAARLLDHDGRPMLRHAGGVATLATSIWLPGKNGLIRFPLAPFIDSSPSTAIELRSDLPVIAVDSRGSFLSSWNDYLLIGEFVHPNTPSPKHRVPDGISVPSAWTTGHKINLETQQPVATTTYLTSEGKTVLAPDFVIYHGDRIQGLAFASEDDRLMATSSSYGNAPSTLPVLRLNSPLLTGKPDGQTSLSGVETRPYWLAGSGQTLFTLPMPPGSEGLFWEGRRIFVAFEGGAILYRKRWTHIEDGILSLDLSRLMAPEKILR
jgi:hypothetical protein